MLDWVTSPSPPLQGLQSLNHTPQQGAPLPSSHQLLKPTTQDKTTLTQVLLSETRVREVFADKGYLSKALLERLWQRGLHLVTSICRNMKSYLMPLLDKLLLTPVSDKGMRL